MRRNRVYCSSILTWLELLLPCIELQKAKKISEKNAVSLYWYCMLAGTVRRFTHWNKSRRSRLLCMERGKWFLERKTLFNQRFGMRVLHEIETKSLPLLLFWLILMSLFFLLVYRSSAWQKKSVGKWMWEERRTGRQTSRHAYAHTYRGATTADEHRTYGTSVYHQYKD